MSNTQKIRDEISAKIAEALQSDCPPWRKPWTDNVVNTGIPRNFSTNKKYNGINTLLLMMSSSYHGFQSMFWGTKRQWESLGAVVQSPKEFDPNWGTGIIFASSFPQKKKSPIKGVENNIFFFRYYIVYNLEQVAAPTVQEILDFDKTKQRSLARKFLNRNVSGFTGELVTELQARIIKRLESMKPRFSITSDNYMFARDFIAGTGATIKHGGNKAGYYNPPLDYIQLPFPDQFDTIEAYYETAYHELCHWGESDSRVGKSRRGKNEYAFSELVAEIGACFLAYETKMPLASQMLPRSTSYIKSWLNHMEGDSQYIFTAARQASKVCDYLTKIQKPMVFG